MSLLTEPIGSIPRPQALMEGARALAAGRITRAELDALFDDAVRETIELFEATGSPVVTDGEQSKPSFATYPIHELGTLAPDGVTISFADGHTRQLPRLTAGPFRYTTYAETFLERAQRYAHAPVKQAVISASAVSLLYPPQGIEGYGRNAFLEDLVREQESDIRRCLDRGAHVVQIDFTEGRLSVKLDRPGSCSGASSISTTECSTASRPKSGSASACTRARAAITTRRTAQTWITPSCCQICSCSRLGASISSSRASPTARPGQHIFVGVTDPNDARVETPEEVRDRVLEAARYIPLDQLGTTDDCGFSPFGDDTSTAQDTAFAKIRARVAGTAMAADVLGA